MNLWTYVAVSAAIVMFCAFLVWISPNSTQTAIAIISLITGWWFQSPGEIVQKAVTLTRPLQPLAQPVEQHSTTQKEQA